MALHGGAMPDFMASYPRWASRVLNRANALVVPSPFLQRALEAHGFFAQVVPNVVDLHIYPYRHRRVLKPRLLWMRTFDQIYNPQMALRVLARLREHVPGATLVMAGQNNGLELQTRQLSEQLGLTDCVRFAGFLGQEQKIAEVEAADIFLNTNRIDNTPVAVLEACAAGLPVVTTRVGGIPDLLTHEGTGLLVEDDDDQAMACAVERLLLEPDLAGLLSANGRSLAMRSSWEQVHPEWQRIFMEARGGASIPREVS
jgi:glycosyltransferase involved in cell wall biosynthesis